MNNNEIRNIETAFIIGVAAGAFIVGTASKKLFKKMQHESIIKSMKIRALTDYVNESLEVDPNMNAAVSKALVDLKFINIVDQEF